MERAQYTNGLETAVTSSRARAGQRYPATGAGCTSSPKPKEDEPLRNGPLVHRHASVSRAVRGTVSPLERLAALKTVDGPGDLRQRNARMWLHEGMWESSRLHLGSRLPINLRRFLAEQLGPNLRVESDTIVALQPRSDEALMRELARAIRRFSAERARQVWSECAIGLSRLKSEFFRTPAGERCPVMLCLRCACIGAGPLDEHAGSNCLQVNLASALKDFQASPSNDCGGVPDGILQAIENFRMAREAAGLEHHDLDCFVSDHQIIFTWRPLAQGSQP